MSIFLEAKDLQKQYNPPNGIFAVGKDGGIDLEIREGEIFSLLGPNGAGKTTCISMMSTLLTPTHGDVTINGYSVTKDALQAKQQIGVVPQELALYPTLSARQNLEFFGRMYGGTGKELKQRADEVLDLLGLRDRGNARIDTYSGGMKRRVNIGVGLMHRPKMVFLDEPTVAIDPQSRRNILDTVKELNRNGMTVLYTTHYMEEAQELSHRVAIIDHGQIIASGTIGELTQQVGEKDTLVFKISGIPSGLVEKLEQLEGIDGVLVNDEQLEVIAGRGRSVLPAVINTIEEFGVTMNSIEIREPNLEAVFLHLTGRGLRD